ncbi:MAG: RluA family pseudouridine synthase [Anaerolineales bacterium]|nr:RluA family pseudouridine synthase [Anaerolineales bacterium]
MSEETIILHNQTERELRLDKFLADCLEKYSRSFIQKLISEGRVNVDGFPIYKKSELLNPGAEVEITIPPARDTTLIGEDIPLDILFENDDLIVINKPAGMVVHPALGHASGTLVQAVLGYAPEIEGVGGIKRPGLVHRLDQNTSGVIMLAKNDRAHQFLQDQFQARTVNKQYLALIDGRPPTPQGRVEVAIGRDSKYRQRMAPALERDGKEAISEYFTQEVFPEHTLIKVSILTGRTHQIRVHMAFLSCPVVGDTVYGRKKPSIKIQRQFLHAFRLSILIPGEKTKKTFEAPLASELVDVLDLLRNNKEGAH